MIPTRYIIAIMNSIGLAIIYGFKSYLNIAIVAMVNGTAVAEMEKKPNVTPEVCIILDSFYIIF